MKKVVIIGAGPAGLTAGLELLKKSKEYEVIIIEEQNQVGGISKTINYNGNRMDLGGHRFFSKNKEVNDFWNEIMPIQGVDSFDDEMFNLHKQVVKGGPNPNTENKVMLIRRRVSRIYYLKKFFDYPINLSFNTIKNLGFVRTLQSGFSYIKSVLIKKKETSLENFYINRFGKKLYKMFFEKYTEKLWGRSPKNISPDWGEQRVKKISILYIFKDILSKRFLKKQKNIETSLIEEFYYPKYGPGQLWETVAEEFVKKGGTILNNHKVIKIKNDENKIKSVLCENNKKVIEIKADIFISSMPIKDLVISLSKKAPDSIKKIAKNLPYRDFMTVGLLVNKMDLKNETKLKTINNIIPDCWIYVQEPNVKMGRIQIFNNWSPYMVQNTDNVWLGLEYFCNEGDNLWKMNDNEFAKYAIKELNSMKIISEENVLDYHVERVKKAYPAYFDSYKDINQVINFLNKYENLYCIGRNGQHRYNNMDHSMITAFITVNNIINNKVSKEEIWNVNTEKEYHETKKIN